MQSGTRGKPEVFNFADLSREAIFELLQKYHLNLTVDEALTIQNQLLKRPPTRAECILWSIQGSEHCSYKSSRSHLKQFNTEGPHVILGPKEDAGIVAVAQDHTGLRYGIVISHESHNHPSQIVPFEGAATGVGGNVRDVCCMGAEVIAVADGLRFGEVNRVKTQWIYSGVVKGIGGYGNPLGIPNIAGDVYFDAGYNDNCLVTVVTLGVVREDHIIHSYAPKNAANHVFILVGKPTDNSGFGGASFASDTLRDAQEEHNKGAIQEPNAFLQRHLLKANYALFQWLQQNQLLDQVGFKDLGAGGIACASVELAEAAGFGAEIDLTRVPTSMHNLDPAVILCSETQERFMWVVPESLVEIILDHYNKTFALPQVSVGACATVIGHVRADDLYIVHDQHQELVCAKARDITQGILYDRPFAAEVKQLQEPSLSLPHDYNQILLQLLSHPNVASRVPLYETYDKQVQGRTIIEAGFADAGVMAPFNEERYPVEIRQTGIALSLDHNPRFNKIDAYWGAVNAVIEAVRNVVAVGANPIALTDCLCFGNPEREAQMAEFVDAVRGIADAARAITLKQHAHANAHANENTNANTNTNATLPIVSGNVSFYNESETKGAIPPSPMISCLGAMPDVNYAITFDLKKSESILILIGERKDECGGSVYYALHDELGANVPKPDLSTIAAEVHAVSEAIQQGLVLAAHDISEGGVAVALAEMSFKNKIGATINIPGELPLDKKLFSETGGFILEVAKDKLKTLRKILFHYGVSHCVLGETQSSPYLKINDVVDLPIDEAKEVWLNGLRQIGL